jgi:hypothetical protein
VALRFSLPPIPGKLLRGLGSPIVRRLVGGLLFVAAWAVLNTLFNLRYPARIVEPEWWYLLPSIDVTVLLGILALVALLGRELPRRVLLGLVAVILFVRLFRLSDGLITQNYFRNIDLALDVPLLPELVRLMWSTLPWYRFVLLAIGVLLTLGVSGLLVMASLMHTQKFFSASRLHPALFGAVVLAFVGFADRWPPTSHSELHKGLFGVSLVPVLAQQVKLADAASNLQLIKRTEIAAVQRRLQRTPGNLELLKGADLQLLLLESYGATVFRNHDHLLRVQSSFLAFETLMKQVGYQVASLMVDSSTYGGGSWLAHATLASGVRVADGRDYAVVRSGDLPLTMAAAFGRAGYRSIVVQPGTTRPFPEGEIRGFAAKYYSYEMGYKGPSFGWAPMPDQYVLDFVHRKEIAQARTPVFVQYALVSSHAPWHIQPPVVEDWSELGDGAIYHRLGARSYPVSWSTMSRGGDAYAESILYDFEIVKRYVAQVAERPTFFIVMGDHQPPILPGDDASHAVPMHILSKDPALMARFSEVGFVPGMYPNDNGKPLGMEKLYALLLDRLSAVPPRLAGPAAPPAPGAMKQQ